MKKFTATLLIIFFLSILLNIFHLPLGSFFLFISLVGTIVLLIVGLFKINKQKASQDIQAPTYKSFLLFTFLYLILLIYSVCKVQFWLHWIFIQYVVFIVLSIIVVLLILNKWEIRSNFLIFVKQRYFSTFLAILSIGLMIIPYSNFIYWSEIARMPEMPKAENDSDYKCASLGRYIWALKREGKVEIAEEIIFQNHELCNSSRYNVEIAQDSESDKHKFFVTFLEGDRFIRNINNHIKIDIEGRDSLDFTKQIIPYVGTNAIISGNSITTEYYLKPLTGDSINIRLMMHNDGDPILVDSLQFKIYESNK